MQTIPDIGDVVWIEAFTFGPVVTPRPILVISPRDQNSRQQAFYALPLTTNANLGVVRQLPGSNRYVVIDYPIVIPMPTIGKDTRIERGAVDRQFVAMICGNTPQLNIPAPSPSVPVIASSSSALSPQEIAAALTEGNIKYAIVGGHALAAYGRVRATEDVDVLALDTDAVGRAILPLRDGLHVEVRPRTFSSAIRDTAGTKYADILSAFHGQVFQRSLESARDFANIPVPSIEWLIAMKFVAMTNATRHRDKQLVDAADLTALVTKHHKDAGASLTEIIGVSIERDSTGDPLRGIERWKSVYQAILDGRSFDI